MTSQEIVHIIVKEIVNLKKFKPGEKVTTEGKICMRFKVTRAIARNALQKLVSIGVLFPIKSKGYFFSPHPFHTNINDIQDQFNARCTSMAFKMSELDPELLESSPLKISNTHFFGHTMNFKSIHNYSFFANIWVSNQIIKSHIPFEQNKNFMFLEWLRNKNYSITHTFRVKKYRKLNEVDYISINEYLYISTELIACRQIFIPIENYTDFSISYPF